MEQLDIKQWVLKHKETGEVFKNSLTGEPLTMHAREEAMHYLGCFGLVTFGEGEDQNWTPEYIGKIYDINEFCKLVKRYRRDLRGLMVLHSYLGPSRRNIALYILNTWLST